MELALKTGRRNAARLFRSIAVRRMRGGVKWKPPSIHDIIMKSMRWRPLPVPIAL
jgi:hypothetical protein